MRAVPAADLVILPQRLYMLPHQQKSFRMVVAPPHAAAVPTLHLPPPPNMMMMAPWSLDQGSSFKTVRLNSSTSFSSSLGYTPTSFRRAGSDAGSSTLNNNNNSSPRTPPRLACTYEFPALTWVTRRPPSLLFGLAPFALLLDLFWGVLLCQRCVCHPGCYCCSCGCCPNNKRPRARDRKRSITTIAEARKKNTAFNVSFRDVNQQQQHVDRCGSSASMAYSVRALPIA